MRRELYDFVLPILTGVLIFFLYEPVREIFSTMVSRLVTVGLAVAATGFLHALLTNRGIGPSFRRGVAFGLGSAFGLWIAQRVLF